jgi:hypothetical protein
VAAAAAAGAAGTSASGAQQQQISAADLSALVRRIRALEERAERAEARLESVEVEKVAMRSEIAELQAENAQVKNALAASQMQMKLVMEDGPAATGHQAQAAEEQRKQYEEAAATWRADMAAMQADMAARMAAIGAEHSKLEGALASLQEAGDEVPERVGLDTMRRDGQQLPPHMQPGQQEARLRAKLQAALQRAREERAHVVKFVGLLQPSDVRPGATLADAAMDALFQELGMPVRVRSARWLRVGGQGGERGMAGGKADGPAGGRAGGRAQAGAPPPRLLLELESARDADALRAVRDRRRLGPGQQVLEEYSKVELAVRGVLLQRSAAMRAGGWADGVGWAWGCSWIVNGREQELPIEAVQAGAEAAGLVPPPPPPRPAAAA